jgi:hypothetical protein
MGGINVWFMRPSQLKPSNHLEEDAHQIGAEKKHKLGWQDTEGYGLTRMLEQESGKTRAVRSSSKMDLELRKKLVKYYIWSVALYGAETLTLRAIDRKHLESFQMWCWRRMEKISWTDYVRNEEVLLRVKKQRNILQEIRLTGLVTFCVETAFCNRLLKER